MGHNFGGEPRLVMPAAGVSWVNGIVGLMLAVEAVLLIALTVIVGMPFWAAFVSLASIGLVALLIWAIVPRTYEVYDDRLVLVFALWRWNIGMDSIELAQPASWWKSYGYWGVRFATAPGKAVELRRRGGSSFSRPNLIISPEDREFFLAELNTSLARYGRNQPTA